MTQETGEAEEKAVAEIRKRQYECFMEGHEPKPWSPGQCAGWAGRGTRALHLFRCKRRDGHGLGALFCAQHAKHEPHELRDARKEAEG